MQKSLEFQNWRMIKLFHPLNAEKLSLLAFVSVIRKAGSSFEIKKDKYLFLNQFATIFGKVLTIECFTNSIALMIISIMQKTFLHYNCILS